jgi:hypothetical protein
LNTKFIEWIGGTDPHSQPQSPVQMPISIIESPEDCGGILDISDMLDATADPKHSNHDHAKEWLDDYEPNGIDELQIKYAISRIANRRNAATPPKHEPH